jgi:hypothetical protein
MYFSTVHNHSMGNHRRVLFSGYVGSKEAGLVAFLPCSSRQIASFSAPGGSTTPAQK